MDLLQEASILRPVDVELRRERKLFVVERSHLSLSLRGREDKGKEMEVLVENLKKEGRDGGDLGRRGGFISGYAE